MTRTISLIIGITVLALAAVPAAFGEGRLAGSGSQDAVAYFRANEFATLVQQPAQLDRRTDAFDRVAPTSPLSSYRDAAERALPPTTGVVGYVDANERGRGPVEPVTVTPTSSGTDIEWPQIGIGFGIGLALALGLGLLLMYRPSRQRSLAH
jgi:hypothetical protein